MVLSSDSWDGESGTGLCHPHLNTGLLEHDSSR